MKGTGDDEIECWEAKILEQLLFGDRQREREFGECGEEKE